MIEIDSEQIQENYCRLQRCEYRFAVGEYLAKRNINPVETLIDLAAQARSEGDLSIPTDVYKTLLSYVAVKPKAQSNHRISVDSNGNETQALENKAAVINYISSSASVIDSESSSV